MQLILRGRRAIKHVPIGRQRINSAKSAGVKFSSSAIKLPGGYLIAQNLNTIQRVIIDVADPYVAIDFPANGLLYPMLGGMADEAYEQTDMQRRLLPPDAPVSGGVSYSRKYQYAGDYLLDVRGLDTAVSGYSYQYIIAIDTETLTEKIMYGGLTITPPGETAAETYVSVVPLGAVGETTYAAFSFVLYANVGDRLFPFIAVADVDQDDSAVPIWPFVDLNEGELDVMPIPYSVINAGPGKVAWIQTYNRPISTSTTWASPEVVVYDIATDSYSRTNLHDLSAPVVGGGVDFAQLSTAELGYCGNGVMYMVFRYGTAAQSGVVSLFTAKSTDYGASWEEVDIGLPFNAAIRGVSVYQERAFVSLEPGKLWLNTLTTNPAGTLYYTEDYGASWNTTPVTYHIGSIGGASNQYTSRALPAYHLSLSPAYDRLGREFAVIGTRVSDDGTVYTMDVFDGFSPTATLLYSIQMFSGAQPITITRFATVFGGKVLPYESE